MALVSALGIVLLLTACGASSPAEEWASQTAIDVCGRSAQTASSAVMTVDGEPTLVVGTENWRDTTNGSFGFTSLDADVVAGVDPATGQVPDRVLCFFTRSVPETDCPDGSTRQQSSSEIIASLHSVALASELASTELVASAHCRDGEPLPERERTYADSHDFDQVLCDFDSCMLDDDLAASLTMLRADDPRSEACGFTEPFVDGVVELESGPVYVAFVGGYTGSLEGTLAPAEVETDWSACLTTTGTSGQVSCGEYFYEDTPFIGVEVEQTGIGVQAQWFDVNSAEPLASISGVSFSECRDEISVSSFGSTSRGLDSRNQVRSSGFSGEELTTVLEDLRDWGQVYQHIDDVSDQDCSALAQLSELSTIQRRLQSHAEQATYLTPEAPAGFDQDLERLQAITSDLVEDLDEDSPLFTPVFELWYVAWFDWPIVGTFVDPAGQVATSDEDLELALLGMPARHGLVTIADPGFANVFETIHQLEAISTQHCGAM